MEIDTVVRALQEKSAQRDRLRLEESRVVWDVIVHVVDGTQ